MKCALIIFTFSIAALWTGCKTEPSTIDYANTLSGRWEVVEAQVGDMDMSEAMQGFFFDFRDNQQIISNFHPTERGDYTSTWQIKGEEVLIDIPGQGQHIFRVSAENPDRITLTGSMMDKKVILDLQTAVTE